MGIFDFLKKKKVENEGIAENLNEFGDEPLTQPENQMQSPADKPEWQPVRPEIGPITGDLNQSAAPESAVLSAALNNLSTAEAEAKSVEMPAAMAEVRLVEEQRPNANVEPVTELPLIRTAEEMLEHIVAASEHISPQMTGSGLESTDQRLEEITGDTVEETQASEMMESVEEQPVKKGFFQKLVEGLSKTRNHVMQGVNDVLSSFTSIDEDFYEELEEALIVGDLGVNTALKIVAGLKEKVKERRIKDPQAVKALLKEELKEQMQTSADAYDFIQKKTVLLVIGVNGVGKTTTIGKLASQYKKAGKKVMLAAADTFRAAAIDQLKEWANRSEVPIVAQAENSDPGAVIYDAIASAKSKEMDILICDTAGRLHNKKNLMNELGKIYRIIGREYPEAHLEVFLVLDSTTGQNALVQAKEFKEMADITGIVLTKLDGTSKGGIAIAIAADLKLPVKYIGVGEGIDDLRPFDADSFVEALFEE